jgi:hypothetical protein
MMEREPRARSFKKVALKNQRIFNLLPKHKLVYIIDINMERSAFHSSQHTRGQASPSGGKGLFNLTPSVFQRRSGCRPDTAKCHAFSEVAHLDLDALTTSVSHLLTLGYEPLVLPCSSMNCGDMVYRRCVVRFRN